MGYYDPDDNPNLLAFKAFAVGLLIGLAILLIGAATVTIIWWLFR